MIWPEWYSRTLVEFIVLDNLASIIHMLAAIAFAVLGCHKRVFWAYLFYQIITTAAKTIVFPEHTLADWSWDLGGDTFEFLIGVGIAEVLGLTSRIKPSGYVEKACSVKGVIIGLIILLAIWLVAFINAMSP